MVAGGVGIAPFRAFVLERLAAPAQALGPSFLLYGVRSDADVLYRDLLQDAVSRGALGILDIGVGDPTSSASESASASSSPRFIADLVADHAEDIWAALQQGGVVYICGGSTGFGEAVSVVGASRTGRGYDGPPAHAPFGRWCLRGRAWLPDTSPPPPCRARRPLNASLRLTGKTAMSLSAPSSPATATSRTLPTEVDATPYLRYPGDGCPMYRGTRACGTMF